MSSPHFCNIQSEKIEPSKLRGQLEIEHSVGGMVFFEGIVRKQNLGRRVRYLEYECYDVLARKEMRRIALEAQERFALVATGQVHRTGRLEVGEIAVCVYALSEHRNEAFLGCRYMIDEIKSRVPIWKKEVYEDNSTNWVRCHHDHGN